MTIKRNLTAKVLCALTLIGLPNLAGCDDSMADPLSADDFESEELTVIGDDGFEVLPAPTQPAELPQTPAAGDGIEAPEDPNQHTVSSVDLSIYKELNHYYYLHLDYYNFYQKIILSYGCGQSEVVFWWEGASQGHTGAVNVQRFIDRLDAISAADDIPSSYANYAASVSNFFTSIRNALDSCTA